MSLAYKLWKIGDILKKEDIQKIVRVDADFKEGVEPVYLNIDFTFENDIISKVSLNKNSISMDKLFFSKKTGGSGTGIYYLYPNITLVNNKPIICKIENNKVKVQNSLLLLQNTLFKSISNFCYKERSGKIKSIINYLKKLKQYTEYSIVNYSLENELNHIQNEENEKNINKINKDIATLQTHLSKIEISKDILDENKDFFNLLRNISELPIDNYIIWISINGKTFYEFVPEVWGNYYSNPFTTIDTKKGFDVFTNKEAEIGYKTDFKAFSYDQYHDSLNYRLDENLPLSKESARNIKYAWMYILSNLIFYYKGLQYIIIPNILNDNKEMLKRAISRFIKANNKLSKKRTILESLRKQEKTLTKEVEKIEIKSEIEKTDLGLVRELNEQVQGLDDELINSVMLDYIFVNVNRTNLSFEILGTIEDVVPSRMSGVVTKMHKYKIEDLVKLGSQKNNNTYLQDYFSRDELYFAVNRSSKDNGNSINTERIYLAKLLLSDIKIKHSDLLGRFEHNRNYGYDKKKRITKDRVKEWIQYSNSFVADEQNLMQFFRSLNKIQEA